MSLTPTDAKQFLAAGNRVETWPQGWIVPASAANSLRIQNVGNAFACRLEHGADRDVVQLGCGAASSRLCDALYVPETDTALRFTGDQLEILVRQEGDRRTATVTANGPLTVTRIPAFFRTHRKLPWFQPLDRSRFPTAPAGWCSWYIHWEHVTEADVLSAAEWLGKHLRPFGCEWLQIDDGWQSEGRSGGLKRDFFRVSAGKFPRGMKWLAAQIRTNGLRPGIWCIPFFQSNPDLEREYPGLYLRRTDGTSVGECPATEPQPPFWLPEKVDGQDRFVSWSGRFAVDASHPSGMAYLRRLAEQLGPEWGYEYVKIDAQSGMAASFDQWRTRRADASQPGAVVYRRGVAAFKEALGEGRFLLNCIGGYDAVDLCEGMRTGTDVHPSWRGVVTARRATCDRLYLNTLACYTDPDVLCLREPLTYAQARVWATLLGVTGQLLMMSDRMHDLPEDRLALLKRILPVADIHPMDLFPLNAEQAPRVFDLKVAHPTLGAWDVVAVFNWDEQQPATFEISAPRLGLAGDGPWLVADADTGEVLGRGVTSIRVTLPAMDCRRLVWRRVEDRPQWIGTDRHVTGGAVDMKNVQWDAGAGTLSGEVELVAGHPCTVWVAVPDGWRLEDPAMGYGPGVARCVLRSPAGGVVPWQMRFTGAT